MTCAVFLEKVKSYFAYLFERYGFQVVFEDEAARPDHCLLVLESNDCRVKLYRTWEEANVLFGTLHAPLSWDDGEGTLGAWFYIRQILHYVTSQEPDINHILAQVRLRSIDEQLEELAERLRPVCTDVVALFREPGSEAKLADFLQWNRNLNQKLMDEYRSKHLDHLG